MEHATVSKVQLCDLAVILFVGRTSVHNALCIFCMILPFSYYLLLVHAADGSIQCLISFCVFVYLFYCCY